MQEYDPETITLASLEDIPEELVPLQKALKQFLQASASHWSPTSLANFLGMDVHTLKAFHPIKYSETRAHTILVLKPIEDAEIDDLKYRAGLC